MEDTYSEGYKRTRASKACDICRTRKLKCDGNSPCHRCQTSQVFCRYSQTQRRKKSSSTVRKSINGSSIDVLNERMSKLESLMTTLANKLDPQSINHSHKVENEDNYGGGRNLDYSRKIDYSSSNDESSSPGTQEPSERTKIEDHPLKYFGTQSSFSVFGRRGVQWLMKVSGDNSLLLKFTSIHSKFHNISVKAVTRWTSAHDKSKLFPFADKEIVKPIVASFFKILGYDNLLMDSTEFYEIFDLYYANAEGKDPNIKKLTSSDLLILNSVIAAGALFLMEDSKIPREDPKIKQYKEFNQVHMDMAIYYYHKVCIISEGIRTIQGILLLILNVDFSPLPQMNYSLISTLVRLAQDLGLHRAEMLTGLPEKEAIKRYQLWYNVHLMDSTLCLKSGKPPIINAGDVTHLISDEHSYEFFPKDLLKRIKTIINAPGYNPNNPKVKEDIEKLRSEFRGHPVKLIILNYYSKLISYSSYTYDRLFKARAVTGKTAEEIMDVIEELNFKLERIRLEIPKPFRPEEGGYMNNIYLNFEECHDYVMLHLQYYLQMLITNRMAFKGSWLNDDLVEIGENSPIIPKQRILMKKSLFAARAILKIYLQLGEVGALFFNFTTFFFCSAFFALFVSILEDPTVSTVRDDVELIQDAFKVFFAKIDFYTERYLERIPTSVIFLSLKTFLKVLIATYNKYDPDDSIDTTSLDSELDLHNRVLAFVTKNQHIQDSLDTQQSEVYDKHPEASLPYSQASMQSQPYFERQVMNPIRNNENKTRDSSCTSNGTVSMSEPVPLQVSNIAHPPPLFPNNSKPDVLESTYSFNDPPLHANMISFEQLGFPDWEVDSGMNFQQLFTIPGMNGPPEGFTPRIPRTDLEQVQPQQQTDFEQPQLRRGEFGF